MDLAPLIAISASSSDTLGIVFSFGILLPALATILVIVAIVSGRGDKAQDDKLAGRWGRKPADPASDS